MAVTINMTETQIDMMDYSSGEESSTTASEIETFQDERPVPPGQLETGSEEPRGHVYLPTHPPESNQDANIKSPPSLIPGSACLEDCPSQVQQEDDEEGESLSSPAWSYREQFKQVNRVVDFIQSPYSPGGCLQFVTHAVSLVMAVCTNCLHHLAPTMQLYRYPASADHVCVCRPVSAAAPLLHYW
jgi:hypothetical protein